MRFLFPLVMTAGLLAGGWAAGAAISADPPIIGSTETIMPTHMQNTDAGAVYHSAESRVYANVAVGVFELGNHSYGSVSEMVNSSWNRNINGAPDGEVFNGWPAKGTNTGSINLTNSGGDFQGIPTYHVWRSSADNPSRDEMSLSMGVPVVQLELNATPGYQPFTLVDVMSAEWDPGLYDAVIVRSDDGLLSARNHRSPRPPEWLEQAFVGTSASGFNSYATPGRYYVLLRPEDFATWTDFGSEHGSLDPAEDDNGNGRSNFLDYASGQDPEAGGLLPVLEVEGSTLTLRRRINGGDAAAVAKFSDDLLTWHALVEGEHYRVADESVSGEMRTLVLELLPDQPERRFFRQGFGQ